MAGSTPTTLVSRDPRLRQRQPSRAEEPAVAAEEECELSSDDEEGGAADKKHPTSQYRGVNWRKERLRWEAVMSTKAGKKKIFLGYYVFEDEEGAARLFDRGQIAYRGRKEADPNFPVEEYSHELDWLEGLGVVEFAERLKAARKELKAVDKQVTAEATLEVAKAGQGEPSSPGPQQHGASDNAADEEIKIRKLARKGPPPPTPCPAAGQASRRKRSRPARQDTQAAKRRKPAAAPAEATAIAELRQDLREAELKIKFLTEKCAGLEALVTEVKDSKTELKIKFLTEKCAGLEALVTEVKDSKTELKRFSAQQESFITHLLADGDQKRTLIAQQLQQLAR